ncbi:CsiV family protein [uncultured Alteromonas sp.]|uniref:CsiV family protein n=1 Tax=uncultured Alteromonas sp. TaxID=179113 RepID=UPI0030D449F5|tara:strand:- start:406 stop:2025 length:1620 start_codon:yes stop_codon:yes gene_type:complete
MRFFRWSPLLAVLASTPLLANDDWWFDVEVIVFERKVAMSALEEQFDLADSLAVPATDADVIGAVITPDISMLKQGIAVCGETNALEWPEFDYFASASSETDAQATNQASKVISKEADSYQLQSTQTNFANELGSPSLMGTQASTGTLSNDDLSDNGLSAEEIASYWVEFLGLDETETVTVPNQPYCVVQKPWLSYYDSKWHIHRPDNRLPAPKELPITPEGSDWPYASHAHLLTKNAQEMASLSRQIRQSRDLTRLLHVTWRQPVKFGKDKAFNVRLFAGNNFSDEFDQDGVQRPPQPPLRFGNTASISGSSGSNGFDENSSGSNSSGSNGFDENSYQNLEDKIQSLDATTSGTSGVSGISETNGLNENQGNSQPFGLNATSTETITSDFFYDLDARLASPAPILFKDLLALDNADVIDDADESNISAAFRAPIWKVDGNIKVFLKYINRVPYLHIDSELFYRQPIPVEGQAAASSSSSMSSVSSNEDANASPEYQLVSLPFSEQRRVISNQLHYFDHPLFGMVVQIRRYKRPSAPEE